MKTRRTRRKSNSDASNVQDSSSEYLEVLPAHLIQKMSRKSMIYAAVGVWMFLAEFVGPAWWSLPQKFRPKRRGACRLRTRAKIELIIYWVSSFHPQLLQVDLRYDVNIGITTPTEA